MAESQHKYAKAVAIESKRRLEVANLLRGGTYSEENIRQTEFDFAESEINVEIAKRKLEIAKGKVNYSINKMEKLSGLSPISGTILTSKIHSGEYFSHELTAQGKF